MAIIVQKFGGTSVGSGERLLQVAAIIENTLKTHQVVAVVSAMSPADKARGTTSLLLEAADRAARGKPFGKPIEAVGKAHLDAVAKALSGKRLRKQMAEVVSAELDRLAGFLDAIEVIRELSPRSQDLLMAAGERLSARLLASVLEDRGVAADWVDLTQVVPEREMDADPAFFRRMQKLLAERCRPAGGRVPIVTGFFGLLPGGLLRVVGRGYTDFTTALIAAGLGNKEAAEMQVWKEVDGIFTADPRRVPNARVLERISPVEASELTYFGSEVLHPFTMERVVAARIPIRIKNTFRPAEPGTVISHPAGKKRKRPSAVTAVTAKNGITVLTVQSNRMYNAHGFMARVFQVLEEYAVNVDLIATSEVSISCTVDRVEELKRAAKALERLGTVSITPGRAILAMVGEGMKFAVGTAGKMFSTLGAAGVNIEMISQGASEINISCVIEENDAEAGLRAIHRAFLEGA